MLSGWLTIVARLAGVQEGRHVEAPGRLDEAQPLAVEARMLFEGMGAVRAMERLDVAIPARVTA